jgi:hypothetical protein
VLCADTLRFLLVRARRITSKGGLGDPVQLSRTGRERCCASLGASPPRGSGRLLQVKSALLTQCALRSNIKICVGARTRQISSKGGLGALVQVSCTQSKAWGLFLFLLFSFQHPATQLTSQPSPGQARSPPGSLDPLAQRTPSCSCPLHGPGALLCARVGAGASPPARGDVAEVVTDCNQSQQKTIFLVPKNFLDLPETHR